MYLGDFKEDGDIFFKFTTRRFSTGAPTTLAGTPVLSVYIDEVTDSEKTTAEAYFDLDIDFDTKTGLNNVRIDLSGDAFFATGGDYTVVITTGTVDSVSVVGEVIACFSIENRVWGQPVGADFTADIAAIKAETALIVADTNETQGKLPTNKFMGSSDGADDDGNINSILAGTVTNAQGADVATDVANMIDANNRVDVGSWLGTAVTLGAGAPDVNIASEDNIDFGATKKASINTEADNALDTAISELGVAAPTATPTVRTALMLLYMALRNKIDVDATAKEVYNDAGTKIASKTLADDGTNYTEAKMA